MVDWKDVLKIGDLHNFFRKGEIMPDALGKEVASRLRALVINSDEIESIAKEFDKVADIEDYDSCLESLYDYGDRFHRLFVNTFDGKEP